MSGATALAEGGRKFKVDVELIFNYFIFISLPYFFQESQLC